MTKKVKDMLDSGDLEMVRLGVHLMKQEVEKEDWEKILTMFSFRKGEEGYPDLYIRKWDWEIEGDNIIISNPTIVTNYTIHTGRGGMKLFEEALKKAVNDQNQGLFKIR